MLLNRKSRQTVSDPLMPDPGGSSLAVQVRDLPGMRAACMNYCGPAATIGKTFEHLQQVVTQAGIGPAGPLLCSFHRLADNTGARVSEEQEDIEATLLVPITKLLDSPPEGVWTRRFSPQRAACLLYSGPMDSSFRQRHLELFAWLDLHALPRAGTAHQHAYLGRSDEKNHWTIEIRVPILAIGSPTAAL